MRLLFIWYGILPISLKIVDTVELYTVNTVTILYMNVTSKGMLTVALRDHLER